MDFAVSYDRESFLAGIAVGRLLLGDDAPGGAQGAVSAAAEQDAGTEQEEDDG